VRPAIRRGLPVLVLGLAGLLLGCQGPGGPKPGAPAHHLERGFRNLDPDYARPDAWTRWRFVVPHLLRTTFARRRLALPVVPNDGRTLRANPPGPTITWVGHSTLLVQLDGVTLLTDPQWSDRASPWARVGPGRVTPPGLRFEDLPPIDLVLISHDHYDHLDEPTVRRLWQAHRPRFLAPLGFRAWFAARGIDAVEELDWWEERAVKGLRLVCVPAQHWSARTLWDENRRLWSGWAVLGRDRRLYFAGDTGYYAPLFEAIGRRLGPFDLAAIPIGAYRPAALMARSHTTPEQALRVLEDVRGRRLVPIHWGTFDLAQEPLAEPPARLEAEARRLGVPAERLWILRHGETRAW
jgi:N-acyl-phosphatidylethanolamine-hydrolysing phospholipase D